MQMSRVTISIDPELERQIRTIQAKKITEKNRAISFSEIMSQIIREGLKLQDDF